jgi:hypothetical protein
LRAAMTGAMAISAWAPLPLGAVARWALICVVVAAIIVRLRGGDFGGRPGAVLIAIGSAALICLCVAVRREGWRTDVGRPRSVASRLSGDQQMFLIGTVVPGSISSWPATRERCFALEVSSSSAPRPVIQARYVGRLPDGFDEGGLVPCTARSRMTARTR